VASPRVLLLFANSGGREREAASEEEVSRRTAGDTLLEDRSGELIQV